MLVPNVRPYRGQFKPTGVPQIDWSHPLTWGLQFYAIDAGGFIAELVRGLKPQNPIGGALLGVMGSPYGAGIRWNNTAQINFSSDDVIRRYTGNPPYSFATACYKTGSVSSFANVFQRGTSDAPPFTNWSFDYNDAGAGQTEITAAVNNNGNISRINMTGLSTDHQFNSLVGTATASVFTAYFNGAVQGSNSGLTIKNDSNGDDIVFGGSWLGYIYYGAFWSRLLSPAEIEQLHLDPYCFLIFPEDLVFFQDNGLVVSTNVNLTGVAATAGVAGFASVTNNFTGVAATAVAESFAPSVGPALIGVQAIAVAEGITNLQTNLVAAAATGAVAGFTPNPSHILSAVAATGVAAPFVGQQKVLNSVAAIGTVAGFILSPSVTLTGVQAIAGVAGFSIPVATNYVLNAGTGLYALNGLAAVMVLNVAPDPPFDFDDSYTSDMPVASGLQFISYNPFGQQMFVRYLTGFAQVYNNVTQSMALQVVTSINNGMPTAQVLGGLR